MKKAFKAHKDQLRSMLDWVREKLEKALLDSSQIRKFEIAAEEAIVNILEHNSRSDSGEIRLIFVDFPKDRFELTIEDDGQAFNPLLEREAPDITVPLEERRIGGLGIPLMMRNVDDLRYERIGNVNRLTLVVFY
jgi:anti-sigma regulatory factor (Ser/Thr protein kinase)